MRLEAKTVRPTMTKIPTSMLAKSRSINFDLPTPRAPNKKTICFQNINLSSNHTLKLHAEFKVLYIIMITICNV